MNNLLDLPNRPIIITSSGDGFSDNWMMPDYPEDFKDASRLADITSSTQMGKAADKMIKWGANNIVFTPNSICQVRFKSNKIDLSNHKYDFDVVFVGSKNFSKNPLSRNWIEVRKRKKIVELLRKKYSDKLGLFGNKWGNEISQGFIHFDKQQEAFKRGRIVVGANPYSHSDYYSSNRVFLEISSGIPIVELSVPRLDKVIRDNDHLYFAETIDDVINKVDALLKMDRDELYRKAANAAQYIEEKHTQYHRMKFKIDTVKRYIANGNQLDVKFPFFLPEVDLEQEMKYAIRTKK